MATQVRTRLPSDLWLPERSLEKDTLEHFERFCFSLKLADGLGPFRLESWQLAVLEDYFAGVLETLLLIPTGNAKSTLLGALILHHATYVRDNPKVIILGGLGAHARNTLDAATGFIERSPDLDSFWASQKYAMGLITCRHRKAGIRGDIAVMSSGGNGREQGGSSVEGEDWTLLGIEELHRHPDNGAAVRTLTTKAGKRAVGTWEPRIVYVTTAGADLESPLGRLIERATDESEGCIVETDRRPPEFYTRAIDADGDLVMHRWEVPEEEDASDMEVVKRANPASFVTIRKLRRSFKANSAEPWVFLRQHANRWVLDDFAAFDAVALTDAQRDADRIPTQADADHLGLGPLRVFVGMDTAVIRDHTALIPAWQPPSGKVRVSGAQILKPLEGGRRRKLADVISVIEMMREIWPHLSVVFDRNAGGGWIAEQLEAAGIPVIDFDQGKAFEQASGLLGELVDERQVEIVPDDEGQVVRHLSNVVARQVRGGQAWRIDRPKDRSKHIDAADAIAMAVAVAKDPPPLDATPSPDLYAADFGGD